MILNMKRCIKGCQKTARLDKDIIPIIFRDEDVYVYVFIRTHGLCYGDGDFNRGDLW